MKLCLLHTLNYTGKYTLNAGTKDILRQSRLFLKSHIVNIPFICSNIPAAPAYELVRTNIDVNELFNITPRHKF